MVSVVFAARITACSLALPGSEVSACQVDLELLGGLDGIPFALGDDADEIALAHDARAGNVAIELSSMLSSLAPVP